MLYKFCDFWSRSWSTVSQINKFHWNHFCRFDGVLSPLSPRLPQSLPKKVEEKDKAGNFDCPPRLTPCRILSFSSSFVGDDGGKRFSWSVHSSRGQPLQITVDAIVWNQEHVWTQSLYLKGERLFQFSGSEGRGGSSLLERRFCST